MNKIYGGLIVLGILIVSLGGVFADGMYAPRLGYWVEPGQQRAVIFYEEGVETMLVTTDFKGDASEFAWIIPTPSKPMVTKASEKVFTNVAKLAQPQYDNGGWGYRVLEDAMYTSEAEKANGVIVVDSQQIEYYDVITLVASDSKELAEWFEKNNYSYPKEYSYVLDSYIKNGWYFTAVKISADARRAEVVQDLKQGHPTPLKLTFQSDRMIFPLRISSVDFDKGFSLTANLELSAKAISHLKKIGYTDWTTEDGAIKAFNMIVSDAMTGKSYSNSVASNYTLMISQYSYDTLSRYCQPIQQYCVSNNLEQAIRNYFSNQGIYLGYSYDNYVPIQIYLIADGKYEADNFYIQYANWVDNSDIEKLGYDDHGEPYISPKGDDYFITSMSASMQRSQMDEDLVFREAEDNKKVNAGPEFWEVFVYGLLIGIITFLIWLFTPLGILFIVGGLMVFFATSRGLKLAGWILNWVAFMITAVVAVIFLGIAAFNGGLGHYAVLSVLSTAGFALIVMGILMGLEFRHGRE